MIGCIRVMRERWRPRWKPQAMRSSTTKTPKAATAVPRTTPKPPSRARWYTSSCSRRSFRSPETARGGPQATPGRDGFHDLGGQQRASSNGSDGVRWDALAEVALMKSSGGPFEEDVYFVLTYDDGSNSAIHSVRRQTCCHGLQELPGFDNETFIRWQSVRKAYRRCGADSSIAPRAANQCL